MNENELKMFRIASRWERGESPTESEIDFVYNNLPELMQNYGSSINALGNIADTDISARGLRHMAARTLGRDPEATAKRS